MNPASSNQKFRKTLFWFTIIFLSVHIFLGSLSILYPIDFVPGKLNSFYKKLIVLGPFFIDTRIKTSPHLYISDSSPSGDWLPFQDIAQENFSNFQQHPWRYDKLKWSDYERYVTREAHTEIHLLKNIDGSEGKASLELTRYISMVQHSQSDSIWLLFVWNTWQPDSQSVKTDTAFNVVLKPKTVGTSE